jgi:Kef-type K+ transport system membrane component KefB
MNAAEVTVIGDIALVIAVSSVLAAVARRCGQPAVVGQILTGLLLGPSVLGRLPPSLPYWCETG